MLCLREALSWDSYLYEIGIVAKAFECDWRHLVPDACTSPARFFLC